MSGGDQILLILNFYDLIIGRSVFQVFGRKAGIRKKRGFVAVCGKKFSVLIGQEDGRGSWIIVLRADVLQFVAGKEEKKQDA